MGLALLPIAHGASATTVSAQRISYHIVHVAAGLVSNNLGVFIAVREMAVDRRTRCEPRHQSAITPKPAHSVLERIRGLGCAEM